MPLKTQEATENFAEIPDFGNQKRGKCGKPAQKIAVNRTYSAGVNKFIKKREFRMDILARFPTFAVPKKIESWQEYVRLLEKSRS